MRNAFIEELVQAASVNEKIALVVGDLGYGVVEPFAKQFPKRFFNAGVAEQNMMGLSAGLASEGFHVFVYSIANFPTFRCAEQIRNDVDYHQLPVTIVAVGGGVAYGNLGYSHHAVQDYALMRVMPHMLIAAPGDPMEVRGCMRYLISHPCPSYLRLGKAGEPNFHKSIPNIKPGSWLPISEGYGDDRGTILTTGAVLEIAKKLSTQKDGLNMDICSLPLWGMASKGSQAAQVKNCSYLVTIEDHLYDAGFGSWLMESVKGEPELTTKISSHALDSKVCGAVGTQKALYDWAGLGF
jgi:transketolase